MTATIKTVHSPKRSSSGPGFFIRVDFVLDDGSWAKTDLCPTFRNFARWKEIVEKGPGTKINGCILRRRGEISADSRPVIVEEATATTEIKDKQLNLL